jgi:hypothetical protein
VKIETCEPSKANQAPKSNRHHNVNEKQVRKKASEGRVFVLNTTYKLKISAQNAAGMWEYNSNCIEI